MENPTMLPPRRLEAGTAVLPAVLPVPGAGLLPVNAALVRARRPLLLDTGLAALRDGFLAALEDLIDPAELRWIWITHADSDHVGNLAAVLERAPRAKVVTNFVGLAKLGLAGLKIDRFHLLNPGQTLDLGDRRLTALAPPVYDAPETMGAFDPDSGTLFSADCFGALLERPVDDAGELPDEELRAGLLGWSRVDAPWLGDVDRDRFAASLDRVRGLDVRRLVSCHLPPAAGMTAAICDHLVDAPDADPFVGPDQAAFEALMARAVES